LINNSVRIIFEI